jgi:hypothetical protein
MMHGQTNIRFILLIVRCKINTAARKTDIRESLAVIPTDRLISRIIKNY